MSAIMDKPSITAVLPAFNEEAVIVDTVIRTRKALQDTQTPDFEVVVVDDGSTDTTPSLVGDLQAEDSRIRTVTHEQNRGYGAALKTGFDAARMNAVWLMDSDGQFDPADLSLLLEKYQPRTAVFGYRRNRQDSFMRRANHAAFFAVVRATFGHTTGDVNCAFKLFPAELGRGLHSDGAMISTELVIRTRRRGYNIVEVGVPHYPRTAGQATGANPRVVARAFAELWEMRRGRWRDDAE
jgi:glycosyltransferase involved in cell wall biosynthesis